MAHTRKKAFDGLYAQLEETDGHVVLFSAKGEPSIIFKMTNPVQQLCTDAEQYVRFQEVLGGVLQTLGEGYALQKQDILCKQSYHHEVPEDAEFLTRSYFNYFEGREFTEIRTYLIVTQEAQRSQFVQYDPKKWLDFHTKVAKEVMNMVKNRYGDKVFQTKIRENIAIAEMPLSGQTLFEYDPKSNGAADYRTLTEEIIRREENR